MKLYYAPGACSLADHIALIESGSAYELEKVDLQSKKTETGKDYSAINPKGYVPAMELDGGEILTENIAILSYVATTAGKLMPSNGIEHWRVLETTAFISTEIHKNFKPFFSPNSSDTEKDAAKETLGKRFALLEERLRNQPFLFGDNMTIADCYLFVMLFWATGKAGVPISSRLSNYYGHLKKRPGIAQALKEEGLD